MEPDEAGAVSRSSAVPWCWSVWWPPTSSPARQFVRSWWNLPNSRSPNRFQYWAFPLVFVGFGILAGLWPFHTWAPTGHVAAPTAASMLLAGVVMKLGAYGCLRVAMTLFPARFATLAGTHRRARGDWNRVRSAGGPDPEGFQVRDRLFEREPHGFCDPWPGDTQSDWSQRRGSVADVFPRNHCRSLLLFGVVGRMVYDRTHTRNLDELKGMHLLEKIPFAGVTFAAACMASMGMPRVQRFPARTPDPDRRLGQALPPTPFWPAWESSSAWLYTLRALQLAYFTDAPLKSAGVHQGVR